ncbi:e62f2ba8-4dd6-47bb-bdca-650ce58a7e46-CDS [Sclerotinia trifoliorum]|uniref:E62f2ba8-4dd6-47bb-bdca-650ce58a7e46-CDS n=1 Tax=Sclerotinia trifoliorum TaxID=28548 RepID=A0A8H2W577_9HELO|nr:e62f2ba8-4dd6-47bb-bdca-650ce58a7e46-CDS [Sclerotinia trifoliorum]
MPLTIKASVKENIIHTKPLNQDDFAIFGTVIQNPAPEVIPSSTIKALPTNSVQANQGTALKYLDVTHMKDYYGSAPSQRVANAVMNMFVCSSRSLLPSHDSNIKGLFPVTILERHPFTTQTFIPLGISPSEQDDVCYLVVVAPSLTPSLIDEKLPVPVLSPQSNTSDGNGEKLPGRGLPDLNRIQAFLANGSQAVTYGAGTWHAPMVVVGKKPIDFVVVQFANGVGIEDCQEVELEKTDKDNCVAVPHLSRNATWKL